MSKSSARNGASEVGLDLVEEKGPEVLEAVTSIFRNGDDSNRVPSNTPQTWSAAVKSALLAKAPVEGAPLEYGGHRIVEEPTKKLGFGGVIAKFARFFGPGMILTVAYIDPDNFQASVSDGQDF